ncbi:hypothetical protein VTN49DRAFT_4166 [Thermomyces lanuginosus]|uniref:uncharacterized protein n=1 Tax=Thermomyces lanuginosus TaxID=5541 RepID=UPI0037447E80
MSTEEKSAEFKENLKHATQASGDEELARQFAEAAEFMGSLKDRSPPVNLSQDELLETYALFKESVQNPPFDPKSEPTTWGFNFKGKYKFQAWKKLHESGITPAEAQKKYVEFVESLKQKYNL